MKKTLFLLSFILTFSFTAQENYYNDVDLTAEGIALKENLAAKTISAHTNILSYGWGAFQEGDLNPENSSEVILIYGYSASGKTARTRGVNQNGGGQGDWNREHTYAKSIGTPNLGESGPGADAHHLRPSDVSYNSERGNKKFADGSGNSGSVSGGWYPGDEWKGDIARMMMYMYIRYGDRCKPNGVGVGSTSSTPDDMIDLFLEWNAEDPVSDFERQRNTYHENTSNTYAQGNRNPFIDNAYLATKIWGGTPAEDYWGIYTSNDNEAPTTPTNVSLSNVTTSSIGVSWTASTDNIAVTKYEVYVDGNLNGNSTNTNYTISGLNSNTTYAVTVLAKDIANNKSSQSTAVNGTTTIDNEAPTIPTDITITNQTGNGFKASWAASSDNTVVAGYDVFVDGTFNASTANTSYSITGLTESTSYSVSILSKDDAGNKSAQSAPVNATTTDGSAASNEIFFSEYIEGSGNNKAIEIANYTGQTVSLANYSIKLASNGDDFGTQTLTFTNETIANEDVFVIGNSQIAICTSEVDISSKVTYFNGNDALGLFKDDVLIDIIGEENNSSTFGAEVTLKRKSTITSPNTVFNKIDEWVEVANANDCTNLGMHSVSTANLNNLALHSFKMYPNPANGNKIYFNLTNDVSVNIYNVLGKLITTEKINKKNNSIDISNFSKGVYLIKIASPNQIITKKMIKN